MSEQKVAVRSYRWKDEQDRGDGHLYGYSQPKKAEDHAGIFADLWTRVETLGAAKRPILLSLDKDHLHLATTVSVPEPVVSVVNNTGISAGNVTPTARKPAKRARATKKGK